MDIWQILGIETTYVFISSAFFLFLYFIQKLIRVRRFSKEFLPLLGLAFYFLSLSIEYIAVSWYDFFKWETPGDLRLDLFKFFVLMQWITYTLVAFLVEFTLKKTKYLITFYLIVCLIALSIFNSHDDLVFYPTLLAIPLFILIIPMWYLTFLKPLSGLLKRRMIIALIGFVLLTLSNVGRNEEIVNIFGFYFYSVATVFQILSISLMAYGFIALSSFSDIRWKEKLRELFVISNSGICLYAYSFDKNQIIEDSDLIAGGFSGFRIFLAEMVKTTENLQLIDYQNLKIIMDQAKDAMIVLILKDSSSFLREKLRWFTQEFNFFFYDAFQNWQGDIGIFKPVSGIIRRVFLN